MHFRVILKPSQNCVEINLLAFPLNISKMSFSLVGKTNSELVRFVQIPPFQLVKLNALTPTDIYFSRVVLT